MKSQEPWKLGPQCITATVPDVDITNVMLAAPPNYLMGQEVKINNKKLKCNVIVELVLQK
jgi:hypothetical protein